MDRTEASFAPARGGDRTPHTRTRRPGRAASAAAASAAALVTAWGILGPAAALAAPRTTATGTARAADSITLVSQSPWVGPNAPDQSLTLGLRIRSGAPRRDLSIAVTVYGHVTSRSNFDQTLTGRGLGTALAHSPAIPLSSLPTNTRGVTTLTVPVVGDSTPAAAGDWTADLHCVQGSCADVYPVKVVLSDSARSGGASSGAAAANRSSPSTQLVTYLVYDDPSSTSQPLRIALVVPLGVAPPVADAHGRVRSPGTAAVAGLRSLVGALAGAPSVPLTLVPDPATLQYLAAAGHTHLVAQVAALAASTGRQSSSQSFVTVDPSALGAAGTGVEVRTQIRRGATVLASLGVHATTGTWVAGSPLDQNALDLLGPTYGHVVVPQGSVTGPTGPLTATQPFTLGSGRGTSVTAVLADEGLGTRLAAADGPDPTLAAEQLLADLSLVYDEVPNLRGPGGAPAPRGVVAVAPEQWAPSPTFVSAVLAGLEGNPVVTPVTLNQLFAQVPVGADGQPVLRHPAAGTPPAAPGRALRSARRRELGFQSVAGVSAKGAATATTLGDLLLAAESAALSPRQQATAVNGFEVALGAQLRQLSVRSDTIRLTAAAASVPITVIRNTPYAVTVVMQLTSDKLHFPAASSQSPGSSCHDPLVQSSAGRSTFSVECVLDRTTDAVYVDMRARTSGDFRVTVTLASPDDGLSLAGGHLTVRSLSTSAVAIALSAGAVLVLGMWWGRTLWRGRWSRRGAHSRTRSVGDT